MKDNNKHITNLICPITGSRLWYVGRELKSELKILLK